ncbi:MAG: CHAT domain-containing protein [Acidimicrobiia bacterium]|nr:CHAT domain-containing protein [Acidimicrobiia bacterium]
MALDAVHEDPHRAAELATALLEADGVDPTDRIGALWALGRARSEQDRAADACSILASAVELADAEGFVELAAEIRVSRAACLMAIGEPAAASAELSAAEPRLSGGALGRLVMQRGLLGLHAGDLRAARADLDAALPLLEGAGDHLARCRLLANRGIVLSFAGELRRAEVDFEECQRLADVLGQQMIAAGAMHNLGFLRGRAGDVPAALRWFERARSAYAAIGFPGRAVATFESDLCAVLLSGGLHSEAAAAARRAVAAATDGGNRLALAEAELMHAEVLLAQGEGVGAAMLADRAAEGFRQSNRGPWALLAEYVALRAASLRDDAPNRELLERANHLIDPLEGSGWVVEGNVEGNEVRTFAGRLALAVGDIDAARHALERSSLSRRAGISSMRANAWLATAALRAADHDPKGAKRALLAGMRVVDTHRATLGATELRAHASAHGAELAAMGLRMARHGGSAIELLTWAERWHAGALRLPPVRPPRDGRMAGLLAELRRAHAEVREATLGGSDPATAHAAVSAVEAAIRTLSHSTTNPDVAGEVRFDPRRVRSHLRHHSAVLVEYVVVDGHLNAVVVTPRRATAHDLGPMGDLEANVVQTMAMIRRLAFARASSRALDAARVGLDALGAAIERRILLPLGLPDGCPVVVVPTGILQTLPWSVLPTLRLRTVTVAPSAALWSRSEVEPHTSSALEPRALVVAGPDLRHSDREVDEVARLYRHPTVLRGDAATASAVLDAISEVDVAHLTVHGTFRSDSPLFSSLRLSDGPLTLYDLEHLPRAPRTVVLPACDAGMARVHGGDELIGTAAAFLSLGVEAIVAPVTVVPDEAVVALVVDLHREMQAGRSPSSALAAARRGALARGAAEDVAAAHAFVAVGTSAGATLQG